ncbi:MAG: hypothetical protein JW741_10915 [Sedimentisphaerales bacterium]|nr:hypothetical protein [Sedimentisphaerales bacterium]
MEKKLGILGVVVLVAMVTGSSALALAPMGPPTAGLNQGQFRLGAEYGYSEMDLELDWDDETETIVDLESNMFFATLGYGVMDNWEFYVQLGVANAEFDKIETDDPNDPGDDNIGFEGDYGFAYGFGTKYTFWEQMEGLTWGVLFQMKWINSEDTLKGSDFEEGEGYYFETWSDDLELDYYEMQIAVGPTWQAMDGLCIYGGPFVHLVSGDLDVDYSESWAVYDNPEGTGTPIDEGSESGSDSGDLEEESSFGGYVGAQFDVTEQMQVFAEVMFTGDAWGFGIGGGWVF